MTEPTQRRLGRRSLYGVVALLVATSLWLARNSIERVLCVAEPTQDCVFSLARTAADRVENDSRRSDALEAVARAQIAAGDINGAVVTAGRAPHESVLSMALATRALAEIEVGDIDAALATAGRIENRSYRIDTLALIITAQARAGDIEAALETVEWDDFAPVYNGGLRHIAVQQARNGDVADALDTVTGIEGPPFRVDALSAVAVAQAVAGDGDVARQTLNEALDAARLIEPTDIPWAWAQADVVAAMAEIGDVDGAMAVAAAAANTALETQGANARFSVLRIIAVALAEIGAIDAAVQTAEWAVEPEGREHDRNRILVDVAAIQAQAGDIPGAVDLALSITHPTTRARGLRAVAEAAADAGAVDSALEILATTVNLTVREPASVASLLIVFEDWLLEVIQMQARLGDAAAAGISAHLLAEAVPGNAFLEKPARFLAAIARLQAEIGDAEGARTNLSAAVETAGETDLRPTDEAEFLRALAAAQAALGDADAALATIDRIGDDWRSGAFAHVAIACAEAGAIGTALDMAIGIEDSEQRAAALVGIGRVIGDS